MKINKLITFFILVILIFIFFTLCDYFLGFGFGVDFTWKEFFRRLPWTILGCTVCSIYCIIELDLDIVKWYKKKWKKSKNDDQNLDTSR